MSGSWGVAQRIDSMMTVGGGCPALAVNPGGDAIALWRGWLATERARMWSGYTPGEGWGPPEVVEAAVVPDAPCQSVVIDSQRRALSVWWDSEPQRGVWSSRYTPTDGWLTSERVDSGLRDGTGLGLAVDPQGEAIAVWRQTDGRRSDIWTNRHTAEGGWEDPKRIYDDDLVSDASSVDIAVDPNGQATVVWGRSVGGGTQVWAIRYVPSEGWGSGERIDRDDAPMRRIHPEVGVDTMGNVIALWCKSVDSSLEIWSNRYTSGTGWGAAELIHLGEVHPTAPCPLAVSLAGDAIAVWQEWDAGMMVLAKRYTVSSGWGMAERIDEGVGSVWPKVAIDPVGNATAVWLAFGGVSSHRYTPGVGWEGIQQVDGEEPGSGSNSVRLAMDSAGNAVAIWASAGRILANTYEPAPVLSREQ